MARLKNRNSKHRHRIAIIDDDPDLVTSTRRLFERERHEVRTATTAREGIEMVRSWKPHLLILDYCLDGSATARSVVKAIRQFDNRVQILLFTGFAAENPGRKLLAELDIQGYHNKSDGAERLLVLTDAALMHFRALESLRRQRGYLRHILSVTPELTRLQEPEPLLQKALEHLRELLSAGDGLVATSNNGLFILGPASEPVSVRAGTGKYREMQGIKELPECVRIAIRQGLEVKRPQFLETGHLVIPLETRHGDRGCMLLELPRQPRDAREACAIYAQQVMQSLENILLYHVATVDTLTRVYNRGHGMQRLNEALKLASRSGQPTSVAMLDVDHFKRLNDTHSHAAGDLMLRHIAALMREHSRASDILVRYGGEEFFIVLPQTDLAGATVHAERLREAIAASSIDFQGEALRATVSMGLATAQPGFMDAAHLLHVADRGLYQAKNAGRDRVVPVFMNASIDREASPCAH